MIPEYDVFEILPNRSVLWRVCVQGTQRAIETLKAVGSQTLNECFAIDLRTQEILGRVNEARCTARTIASEHQAAVG